MRINRERAILMDSDVLRAVPTSYVDFVYRSLITESLAAEYVEEVLNRSVFQLLITPE